MNSEELKLATAAHVEFCSKKYDRCIEHLDSLLSLKPNNIKVLHNRSVAEYYNSDQNGYESFQSSLLQIIKQAHIRLFDGSTPDDVDHSIIFYNQAVILYYSRQYEKALQILYQIFPLIQLMEDSLAKNVCFLILEICLIVDDVEKALSHVNFIETQYIPAKCQGRSKEEGLTQKTEKDQRIEDFKLRIMDYKAHAFLASKDFGNSEKVVDLMFSIGAEEYSARMMKARLEFTKHKYQDALTVLDVVQNNLGEFAKLGDERTLIYYNNVACIYHYLKKPNLSLFFFNKAFSIYKSVMTLKKNTKEANYGKPALFYSSTYPRLRYNKGVALLYANKPAEAFDCFTEAVQGMSKSALVWHRLAECCIRAYKANNEDIFNFSLKRKELVNGLIGTATSSKVILNTKIYEDSAYSSESQSFAVPVPTLEFATICLRNALALLPSASSKFKLAVLTASAYVHLTIGDPVKAHKIAKKLFEDSASSPLYRYLARLYLAEACILRNKFSEAIDVLSPSNFKECDPSLENVNFDWYPASKISAQCVLHYNLAVVLAIKGDLDKASELLKHIWLFKGPRGEIPIHVVSLALYIELILGHYDTARSIVKQNCPHIFAQN